MSDYIMAVQKNVTGTIVMTEKPPTPKKRVGTQLSAFLHFCLLLLALTTSFVLQANHSGDNDMSSPYKSPYMQVRACVQCILPHRANRVIPLLSWLHHAGVLLSAHGTIPHNK